MPPFPLALGFNAAIPDRSRVQLIARVAPRRALSQVGPPVQAFLSRVVTQVSRHTEERAFACKIRDWGPLIRSVKGSFLACKSKYFLYYYTTFFGKRILIMPFFVGSSCRNLLSEVEQKIGLRYINFLKQQSSMAFKEGSRANIQYIAI